MSTKHDILEASVPVFAEHGYHGASVRGLCAAAGVNVAAINYHFGDKASLYAAVLTHIYEALAPSPMPRVDVADPGATTLQAWVQWYLERLTHPKAALVDRLAVHERSRPTGALSKLARESMQPVFDGLCAILRHAADPRVDEDTIARTALSVVGQCLLYRGSTGLLEQVQGVPDMDLDAVTSHVTALTIAGLEQAGRVPS